MTFSDDPKDTVREYAPDAVRSTAYALAQEADPTMRPPYPMWKVRDDNAFDVTIRGVVHVIERDGSRRGAGVQA